MDAIWTKVLGERKRHEKKTGDGQHFLHSLQFRLRATTRSFDSEHVTRCTSSSPSSRFADIVQKLSAIRLEFCQSKSSDSFALN